MAFLFTMILKPNENTVNEANAQIVLEFECKTFKKKTPPIKI